MHQADEHLIQVLGMLDTVEWETQQLQVFEGLKAGNSILNAIHKVRHGSYVSPAARCWRCAAVCQTLRGH
jgi:hypothetical protein